MVTHTDVGILVRNVDSSRIIGVQVMSDNDSSNEEHKSSEKPRSRVVSSEKRDPNQALEYWTEEKTKSAKPIPFPEPDVPTDESKSDSKSDENASD